MIGSRVKRRNPDALNQYAKKLRDLASREVAVGFPEGGAQAYPDGTSVVEVAASHVYGVGVPERDFMALGKETITPKVKPVLQEMAKLAGKPGASAQDAEALRRLQEAAGQIGQAEIQAAIVNGVWEPNSENPMGKGLREQLAESWDREIPPGMSYAGAKRTFRGSDKPLIDTGHMVGSVTYVVREKSK